LDPLVKDDQAVVLNVKNKGIVIITGCGHSGIINTVNYAKKLTNEDRIDAVLDAMHLSCGMFESIIPKTIDELAKCKPQFIILCHCSGFKAIMK